MSLLSSHCDIKNSDNYFQWVNVTFFVKYCTKKSNKKFYML